MIILITGASHTGKTVLSQKLLEKYKYPYFSIDHLKMGLIRSGNTALTPMSDDSQLTAYLWPIVREMIKTVIENKQNLIVEGCYIPFESYIRNHFADIKKYASIIENRIDDAWCTLETVLKDNTKILELARKYNVNYFLIDGEYEIDL